MRHRPLIVVPALLAVALLAAGCADAGDKIRTDTDPLTSRFAQLDGLESARWLSGTEGDDRVPGPSIYWIDALVTLDAAQLASITDGIVLESVDAPKVRDPLAAELPDGPFVGSPELDAAFSLDEYSSRVAIDEDDGILILVTQFD